MPAISDLSAGDGFMKGFGFVDNTIRQHEQDDQRRQAIDMQGRQQAFQNDLALRSDTRADAALQVQRQQAIAQDDERKANAQYRVDQGRHLDRADDRADRELQLTEGQVRTNQIAADFDLSNKKRAALRDEALQYGATAMNGGAPFPLDLHDKLVKNGMPALSPYSYMDPNFVQTQERLGSVVKAVQSGNLASVNSPEAIDAINQAYADQIGKGVGDFNSAMGGNVVAKRITQLEAGPKGSVVAHVNVQLDNGKSYDAPITVARSADPHDPVRLHDTGMMLDDVMGRYQLSQLAKSPEYQKSVRTMFDTATNASLTASGKDNSHLPANAQMIEYLMKRGSMKFDDAKNLVMSAVDNPEKAARDYAGIILKNQQATGGELTPDQAYQEAKRIFSKPVAAPAQGGAAPAQSAAQPEQSSAPAQIPPLESRVTGQVYQTPRGAMKWMGQGWLPAGAN